MNPIQRKRLGLRAGTAALGLSAVTGFAFAADPMTSAVGGNLPSGDRTFVQKAAIGGMVEVAMGKLAQEKGTSPQVKDFGTKMVADHTKAGEELTKIAADKSVTVPGTIDKSHQKDIDSLSKKSGADFDKAYVKAMISDHKTTVSDFKKESGSGKDGDLKGFAGKTLPTIEQHLAMIQDIDKKMK